MTLVLVRQRMSWRLRLGGKCVYVLALAQRYGLSRAVYRKRGRRVGVLGRRDGGTRTRGGDGGPRPDTTVCVFSTVSGPALAALVTPSPVFQPAKADSVAALRLATQRLPLDSDSREQHHTGGERCGGQGHKQTGPSDHRDKLRSDQTLQQCSD